jgi:putative transposase
MIGELVVFLNQIANRTGHNQMMANALGVHRSGYYAWENRQESAHDQYDKQLIKEAQIIQLETKHRYGSPRVKEALAARGFVAGHNRVVRILKENGLGARKRKSFRVTTQSKKGQYIARNVLERRFTASSPNKVWVSDITYILTADGWLYLCVVLDLYSRRVVGWSMNNRIDTELVCKALLMAIIARQPPLGLLFHSDRGCQYASKEFRRILKEYKLRQSMSRKGNCWDNACSESFFSSLKTELIGGYIFRTREEARAEIFNYVEVFYNKHRLHSYLGYLSPISFEYQSYRVAS